MACLPPSHYQNWRLRLVSRTMGNKLHWVFNYKNYYKFFQLKYPLALPRPQPVTNMNNISTEAQMRFCIINSDLYQTRTYFYEYCQYLAVTCIAWEILFLLPIGKKYFDFCRIVLHEIWQDTNNLNMYLYVIKLTKFSKHILVYWNLRGENLSAWYCNEINFYDIQLSVCRDKWKYIPTFCLVINPLFVPFHI